MPIRNTLRRTSSRSQPLLAALLAGFLLAASGLHAAPGGSEASRFHDDARGRLARNDAAGAIVQAQNALQKEPGLLAAQVLLGQALLKDGQAAAAEAQFEKALQNGARLEDVALPYGQALMMFGNSEKLLQRIPADGLRPTLRAEVLAMRATAHTDVGDMLRKLAARGITPPILQSSNAAEGADAENETFIGRYRGRVRHL